MKVPEIAENGAVVPVSINTSLENVKSISVVVKNNPEYPVYAKAQGLNKHGDVLVTSAQER